MNFAARLLAFSAGDGRINGTTLADVAVADDLVNSRQNKRKHA
jgi:hypothetical protein